MTMLLEEEAFTSKHLKGSAELLLIIPIKPGFVATSETMSYAARLKDLLTAFFEFRKRSADITLKDTPQPIELLEIIYAAQWTVLEQERKLLVAVTFDRSWEEYFARLEAITGYLLDALFMHCEGYDGHTSQDGFASFTEWIRSHQRPTDFLYQSSPDLTTRDIRSLRELARNLGKPEFNDAPVYLKDYASKHQLGDVMCEAKKRPDKGIPSDDDLRLALISLYEFRRFFPETEWIEQRDGRRSAQQIFDQATASLLDPVFQLLEEKYLGQVSVPQLPAAFRVLVEKLSLDSKVVDEWVVSTVYMIALSARKAPAALPGPAPKVPRKSVQANILRPIPEQAYGAVVLIQCHGAHGLVTLVGNQRDEISWENGEAYDAAEKVYRNFAITYGGLTRAQLPEATLRLFPKEFREGMEQRAALLGDIGEPNHPYFWQRPLAANDNAGRRVSLSAVDAVLILQSASADRIRDAVTRLTEAGDTNFSVLHVQNLQRQRLDAFGLREGFSQPQPQFSLEGKLWNTDAKVIDRVPLGEILLGHPDRQNIVAVCTQDPDAHDLFMNGTFMVMRKLEQDAEQLDRLLEGDRSEAEASPKSRLLGRNVEALNSAEDYKSIPNDFDHAGDTQGARCPLQSHARMSNPRFGGKSNAIATPRILRRGVSYNDGKDGGRGLIFMAYNASITSQYETIQRWLNAGNITGLFSWQNDALTGPRSAFYPHACPHAGAPQPSAAEQPCVKLRWGMYLFVPTKEAIEWLMTQQPATVVEPQVRAGQALIEHLHALALRNAAEAVQEWKRFIEDPAYDQQSRAIWAAIRARGGSLETPYGRLIATLDLARPVLYDDGRKYSIDVYGRRLEETMAHHHLGLDAYTNEYKELAAANACFNRALTPQDAYRDAHEIALEVLSQHAIVHGDRKTLWIDKHFATPVIRALATAWFGMPPSAAGQVDWFDHLVDVSRYAFQPHPAESLATRLRAQRAQLNLDSFPIAEGRLGKALDKHYLTSWEPGARARAIRVALVGGIAGFSAPAIAQIQSVLDKWIERDEIGWLSARTHVDGEPDSDLMRVLLEALARRPVPPLLYRTDLHDGARTIVGLGSVYRDVEQSKNTRPEELPEAWLFGGRNAWDEPVSGASPHACPARDAALWAILGAVTALLEQKELKRESRMVVSFRS